MGKRPWQLDDVVVSSNQIAKLENQIAKSSFQRNYDEAVALLSRVKNRKEPSYTDEYWRAVIASAQSSVDHYQKLLEEYKTPLINNLWNPIPLPDPQPTEIIDEVITIPEVEPVPEADLPVIQVSAPAQSDNPKFTAQWDDYFSSPSVTPKFTANYYSWEN